MSTITQIEEGGFYPSDDRLIDVWMSLRGAWYTRSETEEALYTKLTKLMIGRAEQLSHPKHAIEQ
jgi:muramidase (phage lysozyme)